MKKESYVIVLKVVEEKFPILKGYSIEQVKEELADRCPNVCKCLDVDNSKIIDEDYNYFGISYDKLVFNGKEID